MNSDFLYLIELELLAFSLIAIFGSLDKIAERRGNGKSKREGVKE